MAPPSVGQTGSTSQARKRFRIPRKYLLALLAVIVAVGAFFAWKIFSKPALPAGIAGGNGRLEATQIFISAKHAGKINEVLFHEGDTVDAGQVVARMDTSTLDAQLREALARTREAQDARKAARADIDVKKANYDFATKQSTRSEQLVPRGAVSEQEAEVDRSRMLVNRAELVGSRAEAVKAEATIEAAKATADKTRSEIRDTVLVSPIRARVETRVAEPGEVLPEGGRVYSLNDLSDVYMYVFLPATVTGKVVLGSEARIVLDAAPDHPIPAFVSFVSPLAQFTPKTVETAEERHNLTFRVKLQIDRNRLRQWEPLVKTGLPGMGYVRTDPNVAWPSKLQLRPLPRNIWQPTGKAATPTSPLPPPPAAGAPR
jgi:HlyD family secretion protein